MSKMNGEPWIGVRNPLPGVVYPPADRLRTYVDAGALPTTTLVEALGASFAAHAASIALHTQDGTVSYAELDAMTDLAAGALLDLGLAPLDRVLFQAANSPELIYALLGCLKAGLIPVCTLPAHREHEIGFLGNHVAARAHIVQGDDPKFDLETFALKTQSEIPSMRHVVSLRGQPRGGVHRLEDLIAGVDAETAREALLAVPRDPFQVAIFQLSGGTTGTPKAIPRMQNDYLLNALLTREVLKLRAHDVTLMPMPIIHNACMICCLMPTLLAGAAFVIPAAMTTEVWAEIVERSRPTFVYLIRPLLPRFEATLALVPNALKDIRGFWSADSARILREKYDKPAYGMFGMSEGLNMYCREGDPDEVLDWTVGTPLSPFDEVRLLIPGTDTDAEDEEIGEMICRGPYTLSGYYDAAERNLQAFTADGFYRSGDLMVRRVIDGKRYFAFAGRTKDVVDRGTEKINCEEVEQAVGTHPAVAICAVVGMPDPVLGERVCAYLVLRPGHTAPDIPTIQAHMQALGFAKFKWPERLEVIDELPVTKVGKLNKAVLRTQIAERLKREKRDEVGNA